MVAAFVLLSCAFPLATVDRGVDRRQRLGVQRRTLNSPFTETQRSFSPTIAVGVDCLHQALSSGAAEEKGRERRKRESSRSDIGGGGGEAKHLAAPATRCSQSQ